MEHVSEKLPYGKVIKPSGVHSMHVDHVDVRSHISVRLMRSDRKLGNWHLEATVTQQYAVILSHKLITMHSMQCKRSLIKPLTSLRALYWVKNITRRKYINRSDDIYIEHKAVWSQLSKWSIQIMIITINYRPCKMWDKLLIGATVEVWERKSNFLQHFIMDVITYPCRD